ncbi:MAG: methyltransferase domain-containing protein [Acidimicrobiia bacterium]|nr:methyltransferase domain-containing protein [Acidimicrobiia bacterium]
MSAAGDGTRYDGFVDLSNRNNSHTFTVEMVGANKRVLEFGCASGFVSQALRERGCQVVGVEIDPDFASQAKEFCEDVIIGDAEQLDLETLLEGQRFEVAIFGDVLEHMHDPLRMLQRVRNWLVPEGYAVASLPNVAHGAVRLALLQGHFDYRAEGLLDETHLRFFTHDTIKDLFHRAGFVLVETRRTHVGIFESEIPLRREDFDPEVVAGIEADPEATTYQYVVKALVDNALSAAEVVHEREEGQRLEILGLRAELDSARGRIESLTGDLENSKHQGRVLSEQIDILQNEVGAVRAQLAAREDALAHREAYITQLNGKLPFRVYQRLKKLAGG